MLEDLGINRGNFRMLSKRSSFGDNPICCNDSGQFKINVYIEGVSITEEKKLLEDPGIDPGTSRMLSERSTI